MKKKKKMANGWMWQSHRETPLMIVKKKKKKKKKKTPN